MLVIPNVNGKGTEMRRTLSAVAAAVLCLAVASCGPSDDQGKRDQSSQSTTDQSQGDQAQPAKPSPPSPEDLAQSERPQDQVALEGLLKRVDDAQQAQMDAPNQIIADKAFNDAYQAYCSKMQSDGVFNDWTARVKSIFDGKPPSISLETPGGIDAFQDIDTSSPMYQTLLNLKEGDYVKFSMTVSHAEEDAPGQTFQECDTDNTDNGRPRINRFLSGTVTALVPLH